MIRYLPLPQTQSPSTPQFFTGSPIKYLASPQSLPSAQIESPPPAQYLIQSLPEPVIDPLSLSQHQSPIEPLPDPLALSSTEPLTMAQMINGQRNEQGKSHVSKNNSSNSKYSQSWMVQSKESLQKQHAAFHKASFGQVLFCCFTLDSEWFFCLEEIGLPVKASRDELKNCLTYEDLDCMLLVEDIFTTLIHLSKNHTYLVKMLDTVEKIEKTVLKDADIFVDYLLEKARPMQIVQQTWNEVFLQSDASEQKKFLTLFLMKLYQQHVNDFDDAVDSWEKIRKLSIQDTIVSDAMQEKGEERLKNGNLEEALEFFNAAIYNCPLDVNCYKQRAKIHEMLENYKLSSCDLIRVHVLEPDWEEGYAIHDKILKNLDEQWTTSCFKLIDKWKFGAHFYYVIKTNDQDTPKAENDCVSSPPIEEEKKNEEKMPLASHDSDKLVKKAMDMYKRQKFKEILKMFKANILETILYQLALLSHVHLKQLDKARELATIAIQTFTDPRQFSGDKQEVINLKKMFNFIKFLPPTPFGQCGICKTSPQSSIASIYIYDDCSMLDDIFHKGCVMLRCENRCRIFFHFECLSGSNDFTWEESNLKNYIRTICSTPDCQSCIIVAEAFFVDNPKSIKVVDDVLEFKRPEINSLTKTSKTKLTAPNAEEHNNNAISALPSSDEATVPSDNSDSSTQNMTHSSGQAQAAISNEKETKSLPNYKECKGKKAGKNKKKKKAPLLENVAFGEDDISLNQNLTNDFQPEKDMEEALEKAFIESSEEIEKENLLLYLCSVLHVHGAQSASGEIFQTEIKALKQDHRKLLAKSGGLASFLLQSDNVLLKEPDILFLEAMTTVIPDTEPHPLQLNPSQVSATGEDSLLQGMSASGYHAREEYPTPSGNNQIKNPLFPRGLLLEKLDAIRGATGSERLPRAQKAHNKNPNNVPDECAADPSAPLMGTPKPGGPPKPDSMEGVKRRNLPPDKKEKANDSDQSSSEFEESGSSSSSRSSEAEEGGEANDFFFSYSEESRDSMDSFDAEFQACASCERYKPRLEFLEQEYRNTLVKCESEKRNRETAEQKIPSLEAQIEALKDENRNLRKRIEDIECLQSGEATNMPKAAGAAPKGILRAGRRSLPSHLKGPPKPPTPVKKEEDIILCVICHEDLLLLTVNTLQCGHVFHDNCIRRWFVQQKTCPSCRKHTLLTEEFPPLS